MKNIRYVTSQPWGFSDSLIAGSLRNLTAAWKSASRRANSRSRGYRAEKSRNTGRISVSGVLIERFRRGWRCSMISGDIHGHADELEALLKNWLRKQTNGAYRNSGHTAVFLGDYIDRGLDAPRGEHRALHVRSGQRARPDGEPRIQCARLLDARTRRRLPPRTFHQQDSEFTRRRSAHTSTATKIPGGVLDWFYALPLFLETETFRAEHACWNPALMRSAQDLGITRPAVDMFHRSLDKSDALFAPVDELQRPELRFLRARLR